MIAHISFWDLHLPLDEELMIQNFHTNHFINLQVKYKDNKIQDARQTIGLLKPKASVGVISFSRASAGISFLASPHVLTSMQDDLISSLCIEI